MPNKVKAIVLLFTLVLVVELDGCKNKKQVVTRYSPSALALRGRVVYQTQCSACHHSNPKKTGAIGPEVFGSSRELLESKLLRGEYPIRYKAKRNTHAMPVLPHLKNEIVSIHAFLNDENTTAE